MKLSSERKTNRYNRIYKQLMELVRKTDNKIARMSTIASILFHKMDDFSWAGFYLLQDDELIVGPYQGPVACQLLEKNRGVCWTGINKQTNIIVPDVRKFPGHIACDSRSRSEIVIPIRDNKNEIIGVLDIDSGRTDNFDEADAIQLERIVSLIYSS